MDDIEPDKSQLDKSAAERSDYAFEDQQVNRTKVGYPLRVGIHDDKNTTQYTVSRNEGKSKHADLNPLIKGNGFR
jgi:hypothetical protein